MIERIRLDDDQESYKIDMGSNEVVVILCLDGVIEIRGRYETDPYAVLNKYETWTLSNAYRDPSIRAVNPTGAEFLIVRYFRT